MNLLRLKKLAGLNESFDNDEIDPGIKIENLIRQAFDFCDIELTDLHSFPIQYDTSDRLAEVEVKADHNELSIKQLSNLYKSGLAEDYFVTGNSNGNVVIHFKVDPNLDHAT